MRRLRTGQHSSGVSNNAQHKRPKWSCPHKMITKDRQGGWAVGGWVLPHRQREVRSRWPLDFVKNSTIIEVSSTDGKQEGANEHTARRAAA